MPVPASSTTPQKIDRIEYGRFRNVYVYITEACKLRCSGCYMGERLERASKMQFEQIETTLTQWRQMGGSKLTILGGEPTLHPRYEDTIRLANALGYEHVITTSNGLAKANRKFRRLQSDDFTYVQISVDGGSAETHDAVRGAGKFDETLETVKELCDRGFDTRIICTVSKRNERDCLKLLDLADEFGVSLVKYHVLSVIGRGHGSPQDGMEPPEWLEFTDRLHTAAQGYTTRVWYQPTFARRSEMHRFEAEGYRGCIGRTLDRISVFPDGRTYVCSFLFDTDLQFAEMREGRIELNKGPNEFDLFTGALTKPGCGGCKAPGSCMGGCPAEEVVDGRSSCAAYDDIVPVCRLWKSVPAN
ncbi:radical SAM/SPASM domain-containing protein [Streptomyces shenzhenensis]|uniref:Radical SAM protein n=1 Tax=Streptomyces shenzhenensis TaxID=943815 RepID=A0A3M0I564_9ACTN|nr:radical SAM protein [Streptomyces shenzhenensis]RMB81239.1 radical SAM protein [Streptomyces shenzhenensis]